MGRAVSVRYPDHSFLFHTYADTSDLQLDAVRMQEGQPRCSSIPAHLQTLYYAGGGTFIRHCNFAQLFGGN